MGTIHKTRSRPKDNCVKGWVVEMSEILFEDYKNGEIELIEG